MFRALTILAAVGALAVSAAPASATSARVGGKMHLDDISMGIITDKATPKLLDDAAARGWWQRR